MGEGVKMTFPRFFVLISYSQVYELIEKLSARHFLEEEEEED